MFFALKKFLSSLLQKIFYLTETCQDSTTRFSLQSGGKGFVNIYSNTPIQTYLIFTFLWG